MASFEAPEFLEQTPQELLLQAIKLSDFFDLVSLEGTPAKDASKGILEGVDSEIVKDNLTRTISQVMMGERVLATCKAKLTDTEKVSQKLYGHKVPITWRQYYYEVDLPDDCFEDRTIGFVHGTLLENIIKVIKKGRVPKELPAYGIHYKTSHFEKVLNSRAAEKDGILGLVLDIYDHDNRLVPEETLRLHELKHMMDKYLFRTDIFSHELSAYASSQVLVSPNNLRRAAILNFKPRLEKYKTDLDESKARGDSLVMQMILQRRVDEQQARYDATINFPTELLRGATPREVIGFIIPYVDAKDLPLVLEQVHALYETGKFKKSYKPF